MMKLPGAFRHLLFPILPPCYQLLTHHQLENWAIAALKNNAKVKGKIRFSKGEIAAIQGNLQGRLFLTRGGKTKRCSSVFRNRWTQRMMQILQRPGLLPGS